MAENSTLPAACSSLKHIYFGALKASVPPWGFHYPISLSEPW